MKRFLRALALLSVLVPLCAIGALVWSGLHDHLGVADVALVFGNKINADGKPSARLQARLDTAISLFKRGYFKTIIASGGTGKEGFAEGTVMKDYLIQNGIPDHAIIADNQGSDTFASAKNTVDILRSLHLRNH